MILVRPGDAEPVDQGDIIDGCPIFKLGEFNPAVWPPSASVAESRLIVLTQTCDLAQRKSKWINLAAVYPVEELITSGVLKAADVRGPIRAGRVFGWYFLPKSLSLALPESIVDFRQLHTVPIAVLEALCRSGRRLARLQPLYREHLAQHFAHTYSRIGLPMPYETD